MELYLCNLSISVTFIDTLKRRKETLRRFAFDGYVRSYSRDLYRAMMSSRVGSLGLPGRQASSMAD